jgi:hypothetical protein
LQIVSPLLRLKVFHSTGIKEVLWIEDLILSFPHFHRQPRKGAVEKEENFESGVYFHRGAEISTAISTAPVQNNPFALNSKVTFPHFHRPYYYYYI